MKTATKLGVGAGLLAGAFALLLRPRRAAHAEHPPTDGHLPHRFRTALLSYLFF